MSVFEKMTSLASKVREISGTSTAKTLDDMITDISNAMAREDSLLTGTATTYVNPRVTSLRSRAFYSAPFTSVSFPKCTTIGSYAFYYATTLQSASFPVCTTIGSYAFYCCSQLSTAQFPKCTTIYNSAFYGASRMTTGAFQNCSTIYSSAFYNCSSLTTINLLGCKTIQSGAFYNCYKLSAIDLPLCTSIASSAFRYCSSLSSVTLLAPSIGAYAFANCTKLSTIKFTKTTGIASLAASTAFYSTGITSSTGTIYVPLALVASYKSATNWAYFSSRIQGYDPLPGGGGGPGFEPGLAG